MPYERLQARCGDLVQFRWNDPRREEGQTVALLNATSSADALGERQGVPPGHSARMLCIWPMRCIEPCL